MANLHAILYGLVQGITEYLPVSSSAHLILLPRFLGITEPGLAFDVFLHLGTLLATLLYFKKDWIEILKGRSADGITFMHVVVATVPALLVGALIHKWSETFLRNNHVLIVTLTLGGFLLVGIDRFAKRDKILYQMSLKQAVLIGCFQCLALVPGMSRSGSTILGGRWLGFDRTSAARFSFLISAPVTAAALVFELRKFGALLEESVGLQPLALAGFCSFLFGILAIAGLLKLVKKYGFLTFAIYRAGLAFVVFKVLS